MKSHEEFMKEFWELVDQRDRERNETKWLERLLQDIIADEKEREGQ